MERLRIFFVVPDAVHLLDLTGPAHVFYELKELQPTVELLFIGMETAATVSSSAGLDFTNLRYFSDFTLTEEDVLFLPGLDPQQLFAPTYFHRCQPFFAWLARQMENGATLCSVCTGAFLLGAAGLLKGKSCTTHWRYTDQLAARFPGVSLQEDRLFVEDGQIITSAGVSSGIDLALYLVISRVGPETASAIAREVVVYLRRGGGDPQLSVFLQYRNHLDDRIHDAQDFMVRHLAEGCQMPDVARHLNMSLRNFSRRFKKEVGITPGDYLKRIRVERAKQLIKEGRKMQEVTRAIGLKSSNQLRSILQQSK